MILYGFLVLAAGVLAALSGARTAGSRSRRLVSSQFGGRTVGWGRSPFPPFGIMSRRPRVRPLRLAERPNRW